jgi:hypothetical protein
MKLVNMFVLSVVHRDLICNSTRDHDFSFHFLVRLIVVALAFLENRVSLLCQVKLISSCSQDGIDIFFFFPNMRCDMLS